MNNVERQQLKKKEFEKYVEETDGYILRSEYITTKKPIVIEHINCGRVYETTPYHFKNRKQRCRKCSEYNKQKSLRTQNNFYNKIKEEGYTLLSDYNTSKVKVLLRHEKCGNIYDVKPDNFIYGKRCPNCSSSVGEVKIRDILRKYHISFVEQYIFEDCKNIRPLPFDFAIFKDDDLVCLIEYNGIQHYKPVDFFGGQKNLEEVMYRDNIKQKYCYKNNIKLIEIPYWENDKHILKTIKSLRNNI